MFLHEGNVQILRYTFNGKRLKQRVVLARNSTIAPVVVTGDYIGVVPESAVWLHFDADEICRLEDHSEPIEQRRAAQYDVDKLLTNALNHLRQGWRRCMHAKDGHTFCIAPQLPAGTCTESGSS